MVRSIKLFMFMFLIIFSNFLLGCSDDNTDDEYDENINETTTEKNVDSKPKISNSEAEEKLKSLSVGLSIQVDDMKDIIYYKCVENGSISGVQLLPYVALNKNYECKLFDKILYTGEDWIFFDTLYIKDDELHKNIYDRKYKNTNVYSGFVAEIYNATMEEEYYNVLKKAVENPNIKVRLEGKSYIERNLTAEEIADIKKVLDIYDYFSNVKVEGQQTISAEDRRLETAQSLSKSALIKTNNYNVPIQENNSERAKQEKEKCERMNWLIYELENEIGENNKNNGVYKMLSAVGTIIVYRNWALDHYLKIVRNKQMGLEYSLQTEEKMMNDNLEKAERLRQEFQSEYGF